MRTSPGLQGPRRTPNVHETLSRGATAHPNNQFHISGDGHYLQMAASRLFREHNTQLSIYQLPIRSRSP